MTNYTFKKLNDLCIRITDGSHYSPTGIKNGIPMLSVKDMRENGFSYNDCKYISDTDFIELDKADCKPLKDDVLIAKDGSYLKHVFVVKEEKKQAILSSIGILRPNTKLIYPYYLKYYLQTPSVKQTVAKKYVSGSALPRIILKNFGEIEILYRDIAEQKKIASFLSTLDSKIEVNNKIVRELEEMAQTIYNYWFVQFDFPNAKGKPYKSSGGKMVWNEELKREIPYDWEVKSLLDIADYTNGLACQKYRPTSDTFLRVIKIREMNEGFTENSELVRPDIPSKAVVKNGDVLFSWSASLDVKIWTGGTGALNQHIFKVTSKEFPKSFYYYQLLNYLQHFKMMAENRKTTMGHITQEHLEQSRVAVPPVHLALKLENIISPLFEKKINNEIQNQELRSLRDWLLPMLMNGQIKVADTQDEQLSIAAEEDIEYGLGLNIPNNKKPFAKQVLGAKIVSLYQNDPYFTQIKFQKLQFLAEHVIQADLNLNYYFQAAGPYDNRFMHTINDSLKKSKWFDYKNHKYVPLDKQSQINEYYNGYFKPVTNKLERLFSLLQNTTEAEAEIIATIYAVWNNRLIQSLAISDDLLIEDFYKWSKRKQQYTQEQILTGLNWLRTNDFKPTGFGKLIKQAKK